MTEFVVKNNYFEFDRKGTQQVSGTLYIKFTSTYACTFMDRLDSEFLKSQEFNLLVWYRYKDDIFFI